MFFNDAKGETAWSVPDSEPAFVAAMKRGAKMTISSTSRRGTAVTDHYSLSGVTAALAAVAKACT
jgi:invasion protein IalB